MRIGVPTRAGCMKHNVLEENRDSGAALGFMYYFNLYLYFFQNC